jgi:hypothetical protein
MMPQGLQYWGAIAPRWEAVLSMHSMSIIERMADYRTAHQIRETFPKTFCQRHPDHGPMRPLPCAAHLL